MKKPKQNIWIGPQLTTIQNDVEMDFLAYYRPPTIIGLTGPTKSGKTIVARRLTSEFGFHYFNLSAFIREHAKNLGKGNPTWESLRFIGEMIRTELGDDIFARWAMQRMKPLLVSGAKIVFDGVLHPKEVDYFRSINHFHLIGMVAPLEVRFKQAHRWFPHEFNSIDVILKRDKYEHADSKYKIVTPRAPNIIKCLELADDKIEIKDDFNDDNVYNQADRIVNSFQKHESYLQ
jgi:dephospho-CoA kinase